VELLEMVEDLIECELCGKRSEDLRRYSAQHKTRGWIKVCRECWVTLYDANNMIAGSGGSSGASCPTCGL
jgi:hypothetical protein